MWNPGDTVMVVPPLNGGPWAYVCNASSNTTVTWVPVGRVNMTANRSSAAPTTISPGDNYVIVTSAGAVTLPVANTMPTFSEVNIINASGGAVTVTPTGGTISGAAALTVANNTGYAIVPSTGTVWYSVVGAS